jgi:hypothetical protein
MHRRVNNVVWVHVWPQCQIETNCSKKQILKSQIKELE